MRLLIMCLLISLQAQAQRAPSGNQPPLEVELQRIRTEFGNQMYQYRQANQTWDQPSQAVLDHYKEWAQALIEAKKAAYNNPAFCSTNCQQLAAQAEQQVRSSIAVQEKILELARNRVLSDGLRQRQLEEWARSQNPRIDVSALRQEYNQVAIAAAVTAVTPSVAPEGEVAAVTATAAGQEGHEHKHEHENEAVAATGGETPAEESTATPVVAVAALKTTQADDDTTANYRPETCKWAPDMPRRVVQGPGCDKDGSRLCVGYVVCQQKTGDGYFVRMSTCGAENCKAGDRFAQACTKQLPYRSRPASDETNQHPSQRIRDMLANPQASGQ
jgi:hypothetical protein